MASEPSKSEMDIIDEKVKAFVSSLLEHHLVSVRIFVTKAEEGLAKAYDFGGGDWYASYGAVREWLLKQDERTRVAIRQESSEPEEL
jgi:hypothetical protein